ncbi:hypothetical protein B0H13DRAFT_1851410 [Mycena leptocephala]|nr:hypothetical protein B0H13DRAFT_1851410 [Mycena leptocephala]
MSSPRTPSSDAIPFTAILARARARANFAHGTTNMAIALEQFGETGGAWAPRDSRTFLADYDEYVELKTTTIQYCDTLLSAATERDGLAVSLGLINQQATSTTMSTPSTRNLASRSAEFRSSTRLLVRRAEVRDTDNNLHSAPTISAQETSNETKRKYKNIHALKPPNVTVRSPPNKNVPQAASRLTRSQLDALIVVSPKTRRLMRLQTHHATPSPYLRCYFPTPNTDRSSQATEGAPTVEPPPPRRLSATASVDEGVVVTSLPNFGTGGPLRPVGEQGIYPSPLPTPVRNH